MLLAFLVFSAGGFLLGLSFAIPIEKPTKRGATGDENFVSVQPYPVRWHTSHDEIARIKQRQWIRAGVTIVAMLALLYPPFSNMLLELLEIWLTLLGIIAITGIFYQGDAILAYCHHKAITDRARPPHDEPFQSICSQYPGWLTWILNALPTVGICSVFCLCYYIACYWPDLLKAYSH